MRSHFWKAILAAAVLTAPSYAQVPGKGPAPTLQTRTTELQKPQMVTTDQKLDALSAKVAALEATVTGLQNRANLAASSAAELLTQNVNQTKEINSLKSELAALRTRFEDH